MQSFFGFFLEIEFRLIQIKYSWNSLNMRQMLNPRDNKMKNIFRSVNVKIPWQEIPILFRLICISSSISLVRVDLVNLNRWIQCSRFGNRLRDTRFNLANSPNARNTMEKMKEQVSMETKRMIGPVRLSMITKIPPSIDKKTT